LYRVDVTDVVVGEESTYSPMITMRFRGTGFDEAIVGVYSVFQFVVATNLT
jgi:hypothetical protein